MRNIGSVEVTSSILVSSSGNIENKGFLKNKASESLYFLCGCSMRDLVQLACKEKKCIIKNTLGKKNGSDCFRETKRTS